MARIQQSQNIDNLIQGIEFVIENRCSLSDEDLTVLSKVLTRLRFLRRKKGKTNKQILQIVVEVVAILTKVFTSEPPS